MREGEREIKGQEGEGREEEGRGRGKKREGEEEGRDSIPPNENPGYAPDTALNKL